MAEVDSVFWLGAQPMLQPLGSQLSSTWPLYTCGLLTADVLGHKKNTKYTKVKTENLLRSKLRNYSVMSTSSH